MLTIAKTIEELFTPTSTPLILHAGLNDQLRRTQTNEKVWNEKTENSDSFSEVEHKH